MNSSTTRSLSRSQGSSISETRPSNAQLGGGISVGAITGIVAALTVGMSPSTATWYSKLIKPMWAPPLWAFAPLQLIVFVLMGVALSYLWASQMPAARKKVVLFWFWTQLALGLAWSVSFLFGHSLAWSYTIVMLLWCAVVALIWTGSRLSRTAFWFLTPLFLWVTFSSSLTFALLSFNVLRQETAAMDKDPKNANSPKDPPIITGKK